MTSVWKPRSIHKDLALDPLEEKIREINGWVNKVTEENFEATSGSILNITLLENLSDKPSDENIEIMKKVVEIFIEKMSIINLKFNKEGMKIPMAITNLFIRLKDKWENGQGRLLASTMVKYIMDYFRNYTGKIKSKETISEFDRNKCCKIIYFTGLLFDNGLFNAQFCVFLIKEFMKPEEDNIVIFCSFMMSCHKKLSKEPAYVAKILPGIKEFLLEKLSRDTEIPLKTLVRFQCQDVLDLILSSH